MSSIGRDLRSRRFQRRFVGQLLAAVGALATLLQLYDVVEPDKIGKLDVPVWLLVLLGSAVFALIRTLPRPVEQAFSKPKTKIRLVEGDLFTQEESLVIGMCDTFDTEVPHIVAGSSVQGQFLQRVFANDVRGLDDAIDVALAGVPTVGTVNKAGKALRYPLGTVAVLRHQGRRRSYLLAYSQMDETNQARASVDGVWQSLSELWRCVRTFSNGDPLAMPVIGGGQSRLSQVLPAQDSIRLTALSFLLASREEKVCDRLDIIIRPQDVPELDMPELQAFLSSLE